MGQPIEIAVTGSNFDTLQEIAGVFSKKLEAMPGVTDVAIGYEFGKKQLKVVVDEDRAKKILSDHRSGGLNGAGGSLTGPWPRPSSRCAPRRRSMSWFAFPRRSVMIARPFDKILVANSRGNLVPLGSVARVEETEGAYKIDHLEGERVIYVTAQVDGKQATSLAVNQTLLKQSDQIMRPYPGYLVKFSGEFEEQQTTFRSLLISFFDRPFS